MPLGGGAEPAAAEGSVLLQLSIEVRERTSIEKKGEEGSLWLNVYVCLGGAWGL